jgi:hypothetical protein
MPSMHAPFVRYLLIIAAVLICLCAGEFFFEWYRLGMSDAAFVGWAGVNNAKLVDLLSPMARAYNNILAMLIATIGLAIPLTANMHTPKLIDMFLRDRVNRLMLPVFAVGAANVLWVATMVGPNFAPVWAIRLAVFGALAGWALLIPYFYYVVKFLDPSSILARLVSQAKDTIDDVEAGRLDAERGRELVHGRLEEIGTITLKSLDRADRSVALEGIWSLKRLLDFHGERKSRMPAAWFQVSRKDFIGLSHEALEILNEDRTWFEMKALNQAFLAYQQSFPKAADVVSSISDAVRAAAVGASRRNDQKALELCVKYFNNFLREAIKKKDMRSIYDVFYTYRLLALEMKEKPDLLLAIARYFRIYSQAAGAAGLDFIPQLAVFDLGFIVRRAYEAKSNAAEPLLRQVLESPHLKDGKPILMVVKAKVALGGFFQERGLGPECKLVAANLEGVPRDALDAAERDLLNAERSFHEVTDRQVNLEYLTPERRQHAQEFVRGLVGG